MSTARVPNINPAAPIPDDFQLYFPSVDTPKISYRKWLESRDPNSGALFRFGPKVPRIAVIGSGAAGLVAAYELSKAGASVVVFEATSRIGGRLYADKFPSGAKSETSDIAEMGAMRFPPSEETFFYYLADVFGIPSNSDFPDPGTVPTLLSFGGTTLPFEKDTRFDIVKNGYDAFLSDDLLSTDGKRVLYSPRRISNALTNAETGAPEVVAMFQPWLDLFGNRSYYAGLYDIFSGRGRWKVPNDTPWSTEDFIKFGVIGIGAGGFGPQYPINFNVEMRQSMNAQDSGQRFLPGGSSQLTDSFANAIGRDNIRIQSPVTRITPFYAEGRELQVAVTFDNASGSSTENFDRAIVATTTRAMELNTNIANVNNPSVRAGPPPIADNSVTESIRRLHMQPSSKVFVRTQKFWENDNSIPRVILTDTKIAQMYTLDYGGTTGDGDASLDAMPRDQESVNTGVVLLTYVWGEDSIRWSAFVGDNKTRVEMLKNDLDDVLQKSEWPDYSKYIVPLNNDYNDNVRVIDWASENYYHGAYSHSHPGGDQFVAQVYYDFQKGIFGPSYGFDSGVYLAGDSVSFQGGWSEGALHTGLNAAVASACSFADSTGVLVNEGLSPANPEKLDRTVYRYSGGFP